jgi:hypothetical protein
MVMGTNQTISEPSAAPKEDTSIDDVKWVQYLWAIPILIGIPGNVMSIVVAVRPNNRNLSPCIYMAAMGVADTVLLLERMASLFAEGFIFRRIIENPLWFIRYVADLTSHSKTHFIPFSAALYHCG